MLRCRAVRLFQAGLTRIGLALVTCAAWSFPVLAEENGVGRELYLEVFVNGQPMNLITRFNDLGDGVLTADAEELRNSGVLPDGAGRSGEVRLDQIEGLGWRLIEPEQTIRFIVPEELLAPRVLSAEPVEPLGDADAGLAPQVDRGYGLVMNYSLSLDRWKSKAGQSGETSSGSFEARAFTPLGALTHSFLFAEDPEGQLEYRRLDTAWRSDFLGRAVQVELGDTGSRGPSWSRPVRLGGITIERNFDLRPDIVTLPLPGFEGSAVLPSTVEVFSETIRSYAAEVPAGPFKIEDLPLSSGSGLAKVIVRDITGRETIVEMPFLVSDKLLRPGTIDFSLSVGRPRLGIGSQSDHYGEETFGVGTLRFGVSKDLTLSTHAEGGDGFVMGGLGATLGVLQYGTVSLSYAQSRSAQGKGSLLELSTELQFGSARLSGRAMTTRGNFADLAAVSADPELVEADLSEFPEYTAQLTASLPMGPGIGGTGAVFYSDVKYRNGEQDRNLGVSFSRQIWGDTSLNVTALSQSGVRDDRVIAAQLHIPLGKQRDISTLVEKRRDGWRQSATASGRSFGADPRYSWRIQADRTERSSLQGNLAHKGNLTRIELEGRHTRGNSSLGARLEGAVVVAGGGVFFSPRIDDSFAVVNAGAPGVEVSAENRPVGKTGRSGKILVPGLRAYDENIVSIDPGNLPLDAAVGATRQTVRPAHHAGTKVDFGVSTDPQEAIVELLDGNQRPIEVGGRVILNGDETSDLIVGFDGEVYLQGLAPRNQLEVRYPDGQNCNAEFHYHSEPGTLTDLRGILCLPNVN